VLALKYPSALRHPTAAVAHMAGRLRALCAMRGQWSQDAARLTPGLLAFFLRNHAELVGGV
jgi:hypothetical protein